MIRDKLNVDFTTGKNARLKPFFFFFLTRLTVNISPDSSASLAKWRLRVNWKSSPIEPSKAAAFLFVLEGSTPTWN